MKRKIIILSLICIISMPSCYALTTRLPQNNIPISAEENFHEQTKSNLFNFLGGIIKLFTGNTNEVSVKSGDIRNISSNIKTYQDIESKNNPDYETSNAKDKTDFGTAILDIIAGILSFFGM